MFDVFGDDYAIFDEWIRKFFDGEQVDYVSRKIATQTNTTKIIFGDDSEVNAQCQYYCQQINLKPDIHIRVFIEVKRTKLLWQDLL